MILLTILSFNGLVRRNDGAITRTAPYRAANSFPLVLVLVGFPTIARASEAPTTGAAVEVEPAVGKEQASRLDPLRRYLTRDLAHSARFLDHGVLQVGVAGGWPHLYRVELSLGLLDHLTVGATAHWLPDQAVPQWSPKVALAFYRWRRFEFGAHYLQTMYPPPEDDADPQTPSFQERAHWVLSTASFSMAWITAGFDAGAVRAVEKDPGKDPTEDGLNPSIHRWRFGGGVHLRAGTRRWGFTANLLLPHLTAELVFDLRFGLFEFRRRGGWRPSGIVWASDRRLPKW